MGNTNRSSTCVLQSRADGDRSPKWASYTIPEEVLITVCVGGGGILIRGGLYVIGHLNGLHIPSLKCYEEEGGGGY